MDDKTKLVSNSWAFPVASIIYDSQESHRKLNETGMEGKMSYDEVQPLEPKRKSEMGVWKP